MFITRFFKRLIDNIRYQKILNKVYKDEEVIAKVSTILGTQFYKDWIGRLYGVVNPAIKDGRWDNQQAFEYTAEGYDTTEHMKQWLLGRMQLLENFIQVNNLFDVLSFDIKRIDNNGNYLFMLYPITLPDTLKSAKQAGWEFFGLVSLTIAGILIF